MSRFDDLADAMDEMAEHLRIEGMDYKARQYEKASASIRKADFVPPDPSDLPNVGDVIRDDIAEWRTLGEIEHLETLREQHPFVPELTKVKALGPQRAKAIYEETGVSTVDGLVELIENDELTEVSGIGDVTAKKIARSAKRFK